MNRVNVSIWRYGWGARAAADLTPPRALFTDPVRWTAGGGAVQVERRVLPGRAAAAVVVGRGGLSRAGTGRPGRVAR